MVHVALLLVVLLMVAGCGPMPDRPMPPATAPVPTTAPVPATAPPPATVVIQPPTATAQPLPPAVATSAPLPPGAAPAPSTPPSAPPPVPRGVADWPVVPVIDTAMQARLRRVLGAGIKMGNRPAVFAKAGDSITADPPFLHDFACPGAGAGLDAAPDLAAVVAYFGVTQFPPGAAKVGCGVANSFSRTSVSAVPGWTSANALAPPRHPPPGCDPPYDTALICELHLLRPGIVLMMFGTNDLGKSDDVDGFAGRLTVLVQQALALGVIPVLSTIPPRLDTPEYAKRVPLFNAAIVRVAAEQQVPLWNYWLALQAPGLPNHGLSADGIHPSVYGCPACDPTNLTPAALGHGYNQRNLTALQVLAKLKRVVIDAGPPDAGAGIDS
jgi:hypothetical protein